MPVEDSAVTELKIDPSHYIKQVSWNGQPAERLSEFDTCFRTKWDNAMEKGYFKYPLGDLTTRVISGKIKYVLQLNVKRATQRRTPQQMNSVSQPFNPDLFNFTKIRKEEILFRIECERTSPTENTKSATSITDGKTLRKHEVTNLIIINVSPYEYCTSLLVPDVQSCLPQVLTADALCLCIKSILLSKHPGLRFGFNSLCAFASINHLHMHSYYTEYPLYIETCEVQHLAGLIYESSIIPVKAFVFSVPTTVNDDDGKLSTNDKQIDSVIEKIIRVTDYLQGIDTPYNVVVTKGVPLEESKGNQMNVIRVFVWPRKYQHFGEKYSEAFNVAFVELSGHIPVKTEEWFNTINEEFIERVYQDAALSNDKYAEIRAQVIRMGQM